MNDRLANLIQRRINHKVFGDSSLIIAIYLSKAIDDH